MLKTIFPYTKKTLSLPQILSNMTRHILSLLLLFLCSSTIFAQKIVGYRNSTSYCPMEISLANSASMTHIPRFAPFWNVEQRSYYGWGKGTLGIFGSAVSHNLGVITKVNDSIHFKNRAYTTGVLGALRIGFEKGAIFAGGGVDFPVLYKSKKFLNGIKEEKERAYFSKEANWILPNVFVGVDVRFMEVKAQYYPTNFWGKNAPTFVTSSTQILNLSVGFNRIWIENWIKSVQKENNDNKEKDEKDKPKRYPWDKNKENET